MRLCHIGSADARVSLAAVIETGASAFCLGGLLAVFRADLMPGSFVTEDGLSSGTS